MSCEELYHQLIDKINKYHPNTRMDVIDAAYQLASVAHDGQYRKSGEPFLIHPLWVANILAELRSDTETVVAAILHDVVEDSNDYSIEYIAENFGDEVALLVDGVTKLKEFKYSSKTDELAENYRKMFFAMSQDIRIIILKICDRLHNMRTLSAMSEEKQKEIATETLEIYAPLSHKLGMSRIRYELEDLGFKYMDNKTYMDLAHKIGHKQAERQKMIEAVIQEVQEKLDSNYLECSVEGRPKHLFSVYKKMISQEKPLDAIYDLHAVRILVNSFEECYVALSHVHAMYSPVPGRFKDYIGNPKPNNYQSLHTTILRNGEPYEVQIRTYDMHRVAEHGIAAHWRYKTGRSGETDTAEDKLQWLGRMLEWHKELIDNEEYIDAIKFDLSIFKKSLYCFTPKGEVYNLNSGATAIDFAYAVHSAVGNHMVGVKVNGVVVPIDYELTTGDRVEILTSQNQTPNLDWLNIVKTTNARTKINQWFRKRNRPENIERGKELLELQAKTVKVSLEDLMANDRSKLVLKRYNSPDLDTLYATVGHGGIKEGQIINHLYSAYKKDKPVELEDLIKEILEQSKKLNKNNKKPKSGISIRGVGDTNVRFSKCCSPLPGDEVTGFVTRGRGVSIHRTDCVNVINLDDASKQRLIEADWDDDNNRVAYRTNLQIRCQNETGMLFNILKVIVDEGLNVEDINQRDEPNIAVLELAVKITNRDHFEHLQDRIKNIPGVFSVTRTAV